ncbi:hypothetical protein CEE34_03790 [Candidatus Aerophobetes bacterium Ae_b3a]|nr:MAG: hypothetical protein CEE34_03790 [Candidatus Aerophobetes bacterium Ae_b3a]
MCQPSLPPTAPCQINSSLTFLQAGTSILANMAIGISRSRRTILVVSKAFLESQYCNFEVAEALQQSFEKKQRIMIPFLLE